jgi:transmembrane sensor
MSSKTDSTTETGSLEEVAADWLQRLTGEFDPEDPVPDPTLRSEAFLTWVRESPKHLRAFLEIKSIESLVRRAAATAPVILQYPKEQAPEAVSIYPSRRCSRPTTRHALWGIAAVLTVFILSALILQFTGPKTYSTGVGEQRWIDLRDRSRILLNTRSRLRVGYSRGLWRVNLLEGEALFFIQHNPQRQFIVSAGDVTIRDLGTQFNVRLRDRDVQVAVVQGSIQVAENAGHGSSPEEASAGAATTKLSAGEVAHLVNGRLSKDPHPDPRRAILWRERLLEFNNTTLGEVAAELNRYNRETIEVVGSAAREPITATVRADDPAQFARMIEIADNAVIVERQSHGWIIRAR